VVEIAILGCPGYIGRRAIESVGHVDVSIDNNAGFGDLLCQNVKINRFGSGCFAIVAVAAADKQGGCGQQQG
jgi:hypothetical protein